MLTAVVPDFIKVDVDCGRLASDQVGTTRAFGLHSEVPVTFEIYAESVSTSYPVYHDASVIPIESPLLTVKDAPTVPGPHQVVFMTGDTPGTGAITSPYDARVAVPFVVFAPGDATGFLPFPNSSIQLGTVITILGAQLTIGNGERTCEDTFARTVRTLTPETCMVGYAAASSLRKIPEARAALIKELMACEDASKAWSIVELLPSFEGKWRQDTIDALWKRFENAVDAESRIQTAFLDALKKADEDHVYRRLADQAGRLLRAKKYKEAMGFLTPLREFHAFKPEHRFYLALAQLKLHVHTLATNRHHPAVEVFSDLYRNSAYPLFETLKKEKSLAPEELFALGFGLAERAGNERDLGRDLLEFIAAKFPRNKVGKSAKNKLKLLAS